LINLPIGAALINLPIGAALINLPIGAALINLPIGAALISARRCERGKGRRPVPQLDKRGVDGAEVDGQIEPKLRQPPRHWRRRSRAEHADREARRPGAIYARRIGPKGQGGRSQISAMLQGLAHYAAGRSLFPVVGGSPLVCLAAEPRGPA